MPITPLETVSFTFRFKVKRDRNAGGTERNISTLVGERGIGERDRLGHFRSGFDKSFAGWMSLLSEKSRQSSLEALWQQDLHRVVDGHDSGDVAFVIDHGQGEQVVLCYGLGHFLDRV